LTRRVIVGESRERGERGRQAELERVARAVALDTVESGRDVSRIVVQRVTEGLYTVEVSCHGEAECERFVYAEEQIRATGADDVPLLGGSMADHDG
jgi:hypothetical protein